MCIIVIFLETAILGVILWSLEIPSDLDVQSCPIKKENQWTDTVLREDIQYNGLIQV